MIMNISYKHGVHKVVITVAVEVTHMVQHISKKEQYFMFTLVDLAQMVDLTVEETLKPVKVEEPLISVQELTHFIVEFLSQVEVAAMDLMAVHLVLQEEDLKVEVQLLVVHAEHKQEEELKLKEVLTEYMEMYQVQQVNLVQEHLPHSLAEATMVVPVVVDGTEEDLDLLLLGQTEVVEDLDSYTQKILHQ